MQQHLLSILLIHTIRKIAIILSDIFTFAYPWCCLTLICDTTYIVYDSCCLIVMHVVIMYNVMHVVLLWYVKLIFLLSYVCPTALPGPHALPSITTSGKASMTVVAMELLQKMFVMADNVCLLHKYRHICSGSRWFALESRKSVDTWWWSS